MKTSEIKFKELPIKSEKNQLYRVFYVIENRDSQVMDGFDEMTSNEKDQVIELIISMATNENYNCKKIRWRLKNYTYGELKPSGHRFFFFIKFRKNIIFFYYSKKKSNSLGAQVYKNIERKKRRYEHEFEKQIPKN